MAKTWTVILRGREIGALGIFYELPPFTITAEDAKEAYAAALLLAYAKYEHLSLVMVLQEE